MIAKTYLGDGVYVRTIEGRDDGLVLTTEDGIRITNEIYLEPEVWHMLLRKVMNG